MSAFCNTANKLEVNFVEYADIKFGLFCIMTTHFGNFSKYPKAFRRKKREQASYKLFCITV